MPTSFDFTYSIGSDGGGAVASGTDGTVTATLDDGTIEVGDTVTFSGFSTASLTAGGVNGATAHYHGTYEFGGEIGFLFGTDPVLNDNTELFAVFIADPSVTAGSTFSAYVASPLPTNTQDLYCFAQGTAIAVPGGQRPVEALAPGDPVLTADGRAVPIRWIGRQRVCAPFAPPMKRLIRIAAGALGGGLPRRDLVLTADHALAFGSLLINAGALVNGTTIRPETAAKPITVYHIETDAHEVLLAEGTPAESLADMGARRSFDNFAEYAALCGPERIVPELPMPRIAAPRLIPEALRVELGIVPDSEIPWAESG